MADEAGGGGGGGEEEAGPASATSSPKNRVKLLCSHGGKILPRPSDGHLKYVGGETRVIAVPRDITFSELMKKLSVEFEDDMVLKYQVMPEDLDVLVTVRSNEDLKHMFDEYDRHESVGNPKLRAFLFPLNPVPIESQTCPVDPYAAEQHYIDALNGMPRVISHFRLPPINANRPSFSISACSSPRCTSPEGNTIDATPHELNLMTSYSNSRLPMHKVHSSPSLCSFNTIHPQGNTLSNHHFFQHNHHHHCQHHQPYHPHGYPPSRPPHEPHRMSPSLSLGRPDIGRVHVGPSPSQYHSSRHKMGSGNSTKYGLYDEHSGFFCRMADRPGSLPQSPRSKFPEESLR